MDPDLCPGQEGHEDAELGGKEELESHDEHSQNCKGTTLQHMVCLLSQGQGGGGGGSGAGVLLRGLWGSEVLIPGKGKNA